MEKEEKINSILKSIENETKKLENSYTNICKKINDLAHYIRINKYDLNIDFIRNVNADFNKYTSKIISEINIENYLNRENNSFINTVKLFEDICDYVILYLERIKECNEDLYKEIYG